MFSGIWTNKAWNAKPPEATAEEMKDSKIFHMAI